MVTTVTVTVAVTVTAMTLPVTAMTGSVVVVATVADSLDRNGRLVHSKAKQTQPLALLCLRPRPRRWFRVRGGGRGRRKNRSRSRDKRGGLCCLNRISHASNSSVLQRPSVSPSLGGDSAVASSRRRRSSKRGEVKHIYRVVRAMRRIPPLRRIARALSRLPWPRHQS